MGNQQKNVPFWSLFAPELANAISLQYRDELEREKIDAIAEFAAGVGHEFNNPLAIIGGRTQLLMREISNPEHQKHLASILSQVKRAYEMIADIRLFSRPPKPEPKNTDVAKVLRSVVAEFTDATDDVEIHWDTHNVVESVFLFLDPVHLHTIFSILCKNSVEAISKSGVIKLTCEQKSTALPHGGTEESQSQGFVTVVVEDDGPGFSSEQLPLLFSPYFSGRQAGRGLGFGLPKAWQLLRQMGGGVSAENRHPRGAKFSVTLQNMRETMTSETANANAKDSSETNES